MMFTSLIFQAFLIYSTDALNSDHLTIDKTIGKSDFCYYVDIFAQQIARNKIRNVPFSRLNEFNYFHYTYSRFLEATASEIYSREDINMRSFRDIGLEYRTRCEGAF